ncbi:hypothetical protein HHX48_16835 [Salinimonas sp. HHU 13199]|uniref:Integral membrane protein n=1 Tax=Salinimonas profundi TaxID=2729140 RepID=A0ABR8LTA9_9ALTE|nr:hypothetical protein [Salinimonas profundi]MBD3587405.1 hypothetical protein [Salinimonas profundi]
MVKSLVTFIVALLAGYIIWQLSPQISGHKEAFDSLGYYGAALTITGIILFAHPYASGSGVVVGQILFFLLMADPGKFWLPGIVFLLLSGIVTIAVAFAVRLTIQNTRILKRQ